jgi:hypothetical protein
MRMICMVVLAASVGCDGGNAVATKPIIDGGAGSITIDAQIKTDSSKDVSVDTGQGGSPSNGGMGGSRDVGGNDGTVDAASGLEGAHPVDGGIKDSSSPMDDVATARKWHPFPLTLEGPVASETGDPNPFRNYRMNVVFTKGDRRILVPGFFAADGNAGETGAVTGDRWRAYFTPDEEGEWTYTVSFRFGPDVALSDDPTVGNAVSPDGLHGTLNVLPTDKVAPDFRARGLVRHVGRHHLRFDDGTYFLKGGADSPENFLAYADFDATTATHRYEPHVADWKSGDPTWKGGKGKGMIGALNYLAQKGMNSVYFLTMNVGGDGKDVWPFIATNKVDRYDISKLDQWNVVFDHMDHLGLMLHVVTQETENDQLLDGGALGPQRRLYLRELVARFGHHLAITWNLGEENSNTTDERKAFSTYLHVLDPYGHLVVVHTYPGQQSAVYTPLLGLVGFGGTSLQISGNTTHSETLKWLNQSAAADHRWVVSLDEIGPAGDGVLTDAEDPNHTDPRKIHLWGNLLAGGAGVEWYFGYSHPHNDLNCEDWRARDRMWDQTRYALEFFGKIPFDDMQSTDALTGASTDFVLSKPGETYAIYLPSGGTTDLDLGSSTQTFRVQWYDPRNGGALQTGSVASVAGPGKVGLGTAPTDSTQDWAILVTR